MVRGGEGTEAGRGGGGRGGGLGVAGIVGGEREELQHGRLPRVGQEHHCSVRRGPRVTWTSGPCHSRVIATSQPCHCDGSIAAQG